MSLFCLKQTSAQRNGSVTTKDQGEQSSHLGWPWPKQGNVRAFITETGPWHNGLCQTAGI